MEIAVQQGVTKDAEEIDRDGQDFSCCLILYPITKYYQEYYEIWSFLIIFE